MCEHIQHTEQRVVCIGHLEQQQEQMSSDITFSMQKTCDRELRVEIVKFLHPRCQSRVESEALKLC